jgi:hypothetical protein
MGWPKENIKWHSFAYNKTIILDQNKTIIKRRKQYSRSKVVHPQNQSLTTRLILFHNKENNGLKNKIEIKVNDCFLK